ncbi:hypothetical protein MTBLM1_40312 [Rhodospirillaceae bacterium LM-1]|nr:hypothetical protein MTBLM1_40312 [Rhodospirillaceae bacterium LM-1]
MGGFNSVAEGLPVANSNVTSSGVPLSSAASENSGFAFTPASTQTSTQASDWASQAFAPSTALAQPMTEYQSAKPSLSGLEASSRTLLTEPVPESVNTSLRKVSPIISKLAREHPENPVRLGGSLLGAPEPAQPQIKPPNPFAKDDLPKLPKINWGDDGNQRIDSEKRAMHENWARLINSTQDFGGIIPTFKRHIETNGDAGRADVADMIGRVSQNNPAHARLFQRELSTALGGETIPARMAGEPVGKAGLLVDAKSNRFSDPDFEKSYWRNAEAYKADFERRQREILRAAEPKPKRPEDYENYIRQPDPPATEEPRQDVLGKRGVILANPQDPANPDRGNFADKLWGPRVAAKPFVDEPRKGTYYFGGAGMDGAYVGDMVKAMQESGVGNSQAVDRSKWSIHEYVDAPMTLLRRDRDGAATDFSQFGKDGKQFNMVGYSHGGLQAAQAAADYAAAGGKVDHLVLVGTPISRDFLDRLQSHPNIGKVIVKDIEGQGDPIRAGMSAGEQIRSVPKLYEDRERGREEGRSLGHFYYAGEDAIGKLRRRELAKQLYDWGLR